jgi:hypothetical protein
MFKGHSQPSVVVHTYKPSTQQAEAGRSKVQGQHGLHSENMSRKEKEKQEITLAAMWRVN